MEDDQVNLTAWTTQIVEAYVSHNSIGADKLPDLIASVHGALLRTATSQPAEAPAPKREPAVPVKKSVTPTYIICLEDGKKFKSLKRHLRSAYDMSPEEYREKWGLPHDYPMAAPAYSQMRSNFAKGQGLGKRTPEPAPAPAPKVGGRRKAA
jgi:predicted transcriptional regulator